MGGNVEVEEVDLLGTLDGFDALEEVGGGGLWVEHRDSELEIGTFGSLVEAGWVSISVCDGSDALDYIGSLQTVGGVLEFHTDPRAVGSGPVAVSLPALEGIDGRPALRSLSGLVGLERVEGDLILRGTGLTSLDGLDSVASVGGELYPGGNPSLSQAAVEAWAEEIEVDGSVTIVDNGKP